MQKKALSVVLLLLLPALLLADWPQWGGDAARSKTPQASKLPDSWEIGRFDRKTGEWDKENAENVAWVSRLGSVTYGTPVIVGGTVLCATNAGAGYRKEAFPPKEEEPIDLGCLLAFNKEDGKFLWQLSVEKHPDGAVIDWPDQGICCSPLVVGQGASAIGYVVTNRGEVVAFDLDGFYDGKNDGVQDENDVAKQGADVLWRYDFAKELGVRPHNMASCSVTATKDLLFVVTGNGRDDSLSTTDKYANLAAPSFIALDIKTGKLVWQDASPGKNLVHGQWGSPAIAEVDGKKQVIFPGGDGWLYAFDAEKPAPGVSKPTLLWKFDCNLKAFTWKPGGAGGKKNNLVATPVVVGGLVYITTGQDPENGEGPAILWCIDPSKRGDVSSELLLNADGSVAPPTRLGGIGEGQKVTPNKNSAVVWSYDGLPGKEVDDRDFEETLHRTIGMVAIAEGLLILTDTSGLVHCLDAKTGKIHWTHDTMSSFWGTPAIAEGKIFLANTDGEVLVLALSKEKKELATNEVGSAVYSSPVLDGQRIYLATRTHLIAIEEE